MVSKKRLDCGFNGYRAPFIPRAPRSIKRRAPHKKLVEESKLCAFELLAAVAGKLLQESESFASSNAAEGKLQCGIHEEKVKLNDNKALKPESLDHGSCAESAFVPDVSVQEYNLLSSFKGIAQTETNNVVEHSSVQATSDIAEKIDCDIKLGICADKNSDGSTTTSKVEGPVCAGDSFNLKVESGGDVQPRNGKDQIDYLSIANISTVNDSICKFVNTNELINSDSSVKFSLYRDPNPGDSSLDQCNNVKVVTRDDDENSFGCNKSNTKVWPSRPQSLIGHQSIRKVMASKYWKAAPKLKDCEYYSTSERVKSFHRYRSSIYSRERCQRVLLKKRKLYDQECSSNRISKLREKGMRGDDSSSVMILHRANGPATNGHPKAKGPHVKFRIKSFKVPELYIEVPETATVGALKRTVLEAVTAILEGGLRVGVVFQGKKVRDDHGSLQQVGISQCSNLDSLGFALEPSFTPVSPSLTCKEVLATSLSDADQPSLRQPATPIILPGISNSSVDHPLVTTLDNVDNNELISHPKTHDDVLMDDAIPDSKALIPLPEMNAVPLAVVPAIKKPNRSELSQRRTRRPFSVAEVEALVEAVEKLGTGRWRDVKFRAFENADHRTYVDLKDKWKTLVHTASISPQQRRGEPVPHELLSRVLSAHSYWSQNPSKQHAKHIVEPPKMVESMEEIVRA